MRAVLSPPEPDGQILYRPYMDSYKRTPKTEVCQVLFAFHFTFQYFALIFLNSFNYYFKKQKQHLLTFPAILLLFPYDISFPQVHLCHFTFLCNNSGWTYKANMLVYVP